MLKINTFVQTGNPGLPIPRDCREVYQRGCTRDGVYTIDPGCMKPFPVYCDMKHGGWIVFQRRRNGQQDFNLNWDDYKNGFGDLKWEFWLGLEKIHCLTTATCRAELRVDLGDSSGRQAYAIYDYFTLESERTNYKVHLGAYSGTAGDGMRACLSRHHADGMPFSTPDRDNDNWPSNCAQQYKSGWWHNSCYCANLNTPYNNPYIRYWTGFSDNVKCTEMKLRSKD